MVRAMLLTVVLYVHNCLFLCGSSAVEGAGNCVVIVDIEVDIESLRKLECVLTPEKNRNWGSY